MTKSTDDTPKGELILHQTEDGRTRIECRFEGELDRDATIRRYRIVRTEGKRSVSHEIFHERAAGDKPFMGMQTTRPNITQHLPEIYLGANSTRRQVRTERARQVSRKAAF